MTVDPYIILSRDTCAVGGADRTPIWIASVKDNDPDGYARILRCLKEHGVDDGGNLLLPRVRRFFTEDRRAEPPKPMPSHRRRCPGCGDYFCSDPAMYAVIHDAEAKAKGRTLLERQAIAKEAAHRIVALPGFNEESEDGMFATVLEGFLLVGIGWRHGVEP